ncbi:MAG: hypothetical protein WAM26_07470, partial [Nitrososphaeraceae archaeon]
KWLALISNIMKTIRLIVILLVIAFIIVVFLVGSGMLFGKATGTGCSPQGNAHRRISCTFQHT